MAKIIYLISVGKLSNQNISAICNEYIKRISPFFQIIQKEIKEFGLKESEEINKESEKLLELISKDSFVIVCDQNGVMLSSQNFFEKLDNIVQRSKSITIIIGGAYGLSNQVKEIADLILSLSPMTFTHQTARLILIEQIYRYCMFKEKHPFIK
ncbi:MAG: 23S rRNA (pseudouridine(1915)-N(3))-methyltransferase RlmH [Exilispira sp.]|jgi:23S rRNA (pseudouridine1915-N3)-methyltransferase|nr:23S rRNA (pseudouridine(1915)-N(3))-methyltransferase RlmH [Exilispira sp.]